MLRFLFPQLLAFLGVIMELIGQAPVAHFAYVLAITHAITAAASPAPSPAGQEAPPAEPPGRRSG